MYSKVCWVSSRSKPCKYLCHRAKPCKYLCHCAKAFQRIRNRNLVLKYLIKNHWLVSHDTLINVLYIPLVQSHGIYYLHFCWAGDTGDYAVNLICGEEGTVLIKY